MKVGKYHEKNNFTGFNNSYYCWFRSKTLDKEALGNLHDKLTDALNELEKKTK